MNSFQHPVEWNSLKKLGYTTLKQVIFYIHLFFELRLLENSVVDDNDITQNILKATYYKIE